MRSELRPSSASIIGGKPLGGLAGSNRIWRDFLRAPPAGFPPLLPGVGPDKELWKRRVELADRAMSGVRTGDAGRLAEKLSLFNRRMGVGEELVERIGDMARGGVFFVVTGQQPGLLGGALMVAYKVAAARALASYLEAELSVPVLPLYWCGSDDADLDEVRELLFLDAEMAPVRARLEIVPGDVGRRVGQLGLDGSRAVWKDMGELLAALPGYRSTNELIERALALSSDHGEAACASIARLFGGGVGVVDGRAEELKSLAADLFERYIEEEEQLLELVFERGRELEGRGYHAQIKRSQNSGVFIVEHGKRKAVLMKERAMLLGALRSGTENLSPGVLLRNLMQDFLFCPLAVVLGPGELAYRAQMADLYDRLGIPRPAVVPRLGGLFLPPQLYSLLERVGLDPVEVLGNPEKIALRVGEALGRGTLEAERDSVAEEVEGALARFTERAAEQLPPSIAGRLASKLADVRKRLRLALSLVDDAGKRRAVEKWPFLKRIDRVIAPDGKPQERLYTMLLPGLFLGEQTGTLFDELARSFMEDLFEGRPRFLLYSGRGREGE